MFTYQEFLSHYNFPVTPKQFATVFGAIPNGVIMLFKGYNSALAPMYVSTGSGRGISELANEDFKSTLKNNRNIRSLFLNDYVSTPQAVSKWNRSVENILWKKVWTLPNRYLLVNKVKYISFKLIHQYYHVKTSIQFKYRCELYFL